MLALLHDGKRLAEPRVGCGWRREDEPLGKDAWRTVFKVIPHRRWNLHRLLACSLVTSLPRDVVGVVSILVWYLEECVDIDLSSQSCMLARKQRRPQKTKAVELPYEGILLSSQV